MRSILVVEDSADHAELIRRAFAPHSEAYRLEVAGSLQEARAIADDFEPDLIIADLALPDGRGTELLSLEGGRPAVPVVVLTGQGDEEAAVDAMRAGALDYFVKSDTVFANLPRTAERALRQWELITDRRRGEAREKVLTDILRYLNETSNPLVAVEQALAAIREHTGMKAGGIRLRDGDDFPFAVTYGFDSAFRESEDLLCARDERCRIIPDSEGRPALVGMCGRVLRGFTDPSLPVFTEGGSYWTNSTTALRPSAGEEDGQICTRGVCPHYGYESQALIPLRTGKEVIGLLHLCDLRKDRLTAELIQFLEDAAQCIGVAVQRHRSEAALEDSEHRFRELFENMSSGVAVYEASPGGEDFVFQHVNRSVERSESVKREEIIGKSILDAFPGVREFGLFDVLQRVWLTGDPEHFPAGEYRDDRITGWRENYVCRLPSGEVVAIYDDVTERVQADELTKIQRDLAVELSAATTTDEAVSLWLRAAIKLSGMDAGGVYLVDRTTGELDLAASQGLSPAFVERTTHYDAEAPSTRLVMAGKPIYAPYTGLDVALDEVQLSEGLTAIAIVPILDQGEVIACLNLASRTFSEIPPHAQHGLETVSTQIGAALVRISAEEALAEAEERYRLTLDAFTDAVHVVDRDLRIVLANSRLGQWLEELGMPGELVGAKLAEVSPFLGESVFAEYEHVFATAESVLTDETTVFNGTEIITRTRKIPMLEGSEVTRVLTLIEDITEHRRMEDAIRESEKRFREMAHLLPVMLYETDAELNITYANEAAIATLGYAPENIEAGINILHLLSPHELERGRCRLQEMGRTNATSTGEYSVRAKDGSFVPCEVNSAPMLGPDGALLGFRGVMRDITGRKRAEEEIRRLNEDLERRVLRRTEQLAAANRELDAFAHCISHDLRAPARRMRGFSQILVDDAADKLAGANLDNLMRVQASAAHLEELIDALLSLSRVSSHDLKRAPVDLTALSKSICEELQQLEPEREVDVTIHEGVTVEGDAELLEVLMRNLLNNAWKFTGKVPHAEIEVGVSRHESGTVYFVGDNGAGFDPDYAATLFTPFGRLHGDDEFPGIGIGLSTVQRIVHRHGGEIRAEGDVDQGATFLFTL